MDALTVQNDMHSMIFVRYKLIEKLKISMQAAMPRIARYVDATATYMC